MNLTLVPVGNLTANVTLYFGVQGSIAGGNISASPLSEVITCDAQYRIVEIVGAVETVVYPQAGTAKFQAYGVAAAGEASTLSIINTDQTNLHNFTLARANSGTISYRLDLMTLTPGSSLIELTANLFVNRPA